MSTDHRVLTREEAAAIGGWAPYAPPPEPPGSVRRTFSGPISALLSNSYRWRLAQLGDFEDLLQVCQWAIEQLYDAGYVLFDSTHAPTYEDGLSAGWAQAVEALRDEDVVHAAKQAIIDWRPGSVPLQQASAALAAAARALAERGPT